MTLSDERILDCGHKPSQHSEHTTGTAHTQDGKEICWACVAELDRKSMIESGRSRTLPLYWRSETGMITNWPGTLRFKATYTKKSRHNFGSDRTDIWFNGPDGFVWHGVQIGGFNEICHARRTKQRS
jgi:hypothetical protein